MELVEGQRQVNVPSGYSDIYILLSVGHCINKTNTCINKKCATVMKKITQNICFLLLFLWGGGF